MTAKLTRKGDYQLFRTEDGTRVLALDDEQFILIGGPRQEKMVGRHDRFEPETILERGKYKFLTFDDEDKEDDRLLLQRDKHFHVVLFVDGLPTGPDREVHYKLAAETIGFDEVETYVQSLTSGSGGERSRSSNEERFADITAVLNNVTFPAEREQLLEAANRKQAPETVIAALQQLENRNYESLQDVTTELVDQTEAKELGITDESPADEVIALIEAMEPAQLHKLRGYEERHNRRDEVLKAIDRHLHH